MSVKKSKAQEQEKCNGGNSFGCSHTEHDRSKRNPNIRCMKCDQRMGCGICVQIARELLCLNCRDWATKTALRAHGHVVPLSVTTDKQVKEMLDRIPF